MGNTAVHSLGEHTQTEVPSEPCTSGYHPADPKQVKKPNYIEAMASRITIAGVEDVYKAKSKKERLAYICAIAFGAVAMIYCSVSITNRYMAEGSISINQSLVIDHVAPFPNVSVCIPVIRNQHARDLLVFPDSVLRRMKRVGMTEEEVTEFFATATIRHENEKQLIEIAGKVGDASLDANPRLMVDLMEPPCHQILSNCAFQGQPFNCCAAAQFLLVDHGPCWLFTMDRIDIFSKSVQVIGGESMDPSKLAYSGLNFQVNIDPSSVAFDDNVASDGMSIHVDTLPLIVSSPTVIPFGADALIQLSPPIKITEITNCAPVKKLPKLERFNFYDSQAVACHADLLNQVIQTYIGCSGMPILTFVPDNATHCSTVFFSMIKQLILGDVPQMSKDVEKLISKLYNRDFLRSLYYNTSCPLPCTRWSYPILSTSYGYIQYRQPHHQPTNSSFSRVRVFFPEASYRLHTEEKINMVYLAFCEMGGVWGVYLGLSIVSVFQAAAYGAIIFWKKKIKKEKTSNLVKIWNEKTNEVVQMKPMGWV